MLSLGCERTVNLVELVNTNNGWLRDRATKEFKVFISRSLNGPWQEVLHTTLVDSRRHPDPLPVQTFRFKKRTQRSLSILIIEDSLNEHYEEFEVELYEADNNAKLGKQAKIMVAIDDT